MLLIFTCLSSILPLGIWTWNFLRETMSLPVLAIFGVPNLPDPVLPMEMKSRCVDRHEMTAYHPDWPTEAKDGATLEKSDRKQRLYLTSWPHCTKPCMFFSVLHKQINPLCGLINLRSPPPVFVTLRVLTMTLKMYLSGLFSLWLK